MAHRVAGQAGATPTIQATGEGAEMNTVSMKMMMIVVQLKL